MLERGIKCSAMFISQLHPSITCELCDAKKLRASDPIRLFSVFFGFFYFPRNFSVVLNLVEVSE